MSPVERKREQQRECSTTRPTPQAPREQLNIDIFFVDQKKIDILKWNLLSIVYQ